MSWKVYDKTGETERCEVKELEYSGTWMGECFVTATVEASAPISFAVFDYLEYRGERFELEMMPTVKKTSSFQYSYDLRFVSMKYELERCQMRDLVPYDNGVVYPTPLTIEFTGTVEYLAERIQACMDALYGTGVWSITVADGVESEEKNISLSNTNCWNALSLVNTEYGLNFYVSGRTVTIGDEQPVISHTFEYGKGNGLYEIERVADTDTGVAGCELSEETRMAGQRTGVHLCAFPAAADAPVVQDGRQDGLCAGRRRACCPVWHQGGEHHV